MSKHQYKYRKSFTYGGIRYDVKADDPVELGVKYAKKLAELQDANRTVSGNTTLSHWAEECVDTYKTNLRPKVRRDYVDLVRHCILEPIGDLQLKAVQPIDCQQCLNRLSGMSNSYINAVFQALHFIFKYAVINGRISTDPTEGLIKPTGTRKKRRALTPGGAGKSPCHGSTAAHVVGLSFDDALRLPSGRGGGVQGL